MKYYIATGLENHELHNVIRDHLAILGHSITYDWTIHGPVWSKGVERCTVVAVHELLGVKEADFVIVLLPGGRGTHIELGIALAAGRKVYFVSNNPEHHAAAPDVCAFYLHPLVQHFFNWEDVITWVKTSIKT